MSGNKLLLDTNAVVALFRGNADLLRLTGNAEWIGASIITIIEFLSFKGLAKTDRDLLFQFRQRIEVIGLDVNDNALIDTTTDLRRRYAVRLPDAIIAATAISRDAVLVTADRALLKIKDVRISVF